MLLYIIRHGDPVYETDSLTPKGARQADALSRRLAAAGIDEVYSSPLGRALMTAKPTAGILKLDVNIEEWMSEDLAWSEFSVLQDKGDRGWLFACQNSNFLKDGDALRPDWYNHAETAGCPAAKKGYERIRAASDDFLQRLGYAREGNVYRILKPGRKRVAAFCHHGFGTTWLSHLLSIPPLVFWAGFNISHTGVTVLEFEHHADGSTSPRCLVHSDMSHLYETGLPMEYNNITRI
ncbi:MAG: histidine phosphatase family protein [Oscillospiraceae bacterium]|jgi:probable phosphoglycerate mutase|nr:histidine phosphatase family protein [Oscillospiraceae bacterium]